MSQIFKKITRWNHGILKHGFSTIEYPFKGYNTTWDKHDKIIQASSLQPEVLESLVQGHDYFKTVVATRKIHEISYVTRPMLLKHLEDYFQTLDDYKIELSLQVNQIAHTSIESIYSLDEYVGVKLGESINAEEYRFINMMGKKYFKKYLVLPNKGFIKSFDAFLVVDILYRTEIMINQSQNNKSIDKRPFEKCLLQFVCDKKDRNKLFKIDGTDSPWKISNINKWIEEKDNKLFF